MKHDLQVLRTNLKKAENEVQRLKSAITREENACQHSWTETYAPEVQEAYTDPGDPPGTMGVDWRGPCYVPRSETPRWKRVCGLCGKIEYSRSTREETTTVRKPVY